MMVNMGVSIFAATILSTALFGLTDGACPNKCSGHGACGQSDICLCQQNWMGGDCSLRVCPYTRAWVDSAQHENDAHYYAECGNKGSCDRTTGVCICDAGYTGSGCRRQACPNDCSGHGTCEFIDELTSEAYTQWDQEKIMGCVCDPGFEGHDCSSKICPKGDDPVTFMSTDMVQYVTITHGDTNVNTQLFLTYHDPYGNSWTTKAITSVSTIETTCANIQTALRQIPNGALKDILATSAPATGGYTVTRSYDPTLAASTGELLSDATDLTSHANTCLITFPSAPGTTGQQNLFTCSTHQNTAAGSQPRLMSTDAADACVVGEYSTSNESYYPLTELATCSNRGICDGSTGECQCFTGHRGLACETQEALV